MNAPTMPAIDTPSLDGDKFYEVIDGQRREQEPTGAFETFMASELAYYLRHFVGANRLGIVVTETLFVLDRTRGLNRRPDAAFVSFVRWPQRPVPSEEAWDVVPDLAIEVISPSNSATAVDSKILEYFAAGVRLVWVIYPVSGRVYVYTSPVQVSILDRTGELNGGDVLPSFRLPMNQLYGLLSKPD